MSTHTGTSHCSCRQNCRHCCQSNAAGEWDRAGRTSVLALAGQGTCVWQWGSHKTPPGHRWYGLGRGASRWGSDTQAATKWTSLRQPEKRIGKKWWGNDLISYHSSLSLSLSFMATIHLRHGERRTWKTHLVFAEERRRVQHKTMGRDTFRLGSIIFIAWAQRNLYVNQVHAYWHQYIRLIILKPNSV